MTSRQIEIFIRLAENLSFAKTAEDLFTTQPTISRELQNLENEIGVALFKRDRHNVKITPAGASFLTEAKQIHFSVKRAVSMVREDHARYEDNLRIGFCHQASVTELWRAMRDFHALFPKIRVQVVSDSLSILQRMFEEESLDIVYGMKTHLTPGKNDGFRLLYKGFYVAVLANDHALANMPEVRLEDLNGHTLLAWNPMEYPQMKNEFNDAIKIALPDCTFNYFNNLSEMEVMAKAGFGVAILPQYSIQPSKEFRMIPLSIPVDEISQKKIDYYAMWHKNRKQCHAEDFVEIMQGYYQ